MNIENMTQILQASIAPCVLISGFGLLLLSLTNRFSRPVDRIRQLVKEEQTATDAKKETLKKQIRIFYRRCLLLRSAIGSIVISIIFVSLIMLLLFSGFFLAIPYLILLIKFAFIISLTFLTIGLIYFLLDIRLTLRSLEIEAKTYLKKN